MKTYILQRDIDESGVSGTGPVGEVAVFPTGQAVLQWSENTLAGVPSISIFPSLEDLETVHGHGGKTRLVEIGQAGNGQAPSLMTEDRIGELCEQFCLGDEIHTFTLGALESKFSEGEFTEGETKIPYVDVSARLFHTGKHRDINYTEKRLDEMVSNFTEPTSELDWDVPVQLDHSSSAKDTVGHIRQVWRSGSDLLGVLRFVGAEAVKNVKQRLWKKLSIGVRLGPTFSIKEASVTPFPYLRNAKLFKEDESMKTGTEAEKPKTEEKPVEKSEEKMTEEKPEVKTPPAPAPEKSAVVGMSEEAKAELARIEAAFSERTAALEAQMAAREAKLKEQEQIAHFKELAAKVDKFCEESVAKSVPAMREKELALLKTFSEEQLALYEELKSLQPPVIDYGVRSVQTSSPTPNENIDQFCDRWDIESGRKTEKK